MFQLKVLAVLTFSLTKQTSAEEFYCLSDDKNPFVMFSSATSYDTVRGDLNDSSISPPPEGCKPVHLWHLVRQGTSLPSAELITQFTKSLLQIKDNILQGHKSGGGELCDADIRALTSWEFPALSEQRAYWLTERGKYEIEEIAHRFRNHLSELLENDFKADALKIRSQLTRRTEQSVSPYLQGMLNSSNEQNIQEGMVNSEGKIFLRYYDFCPGWISQVETNSVVMAEMEKFYTSAQYTNMVKRITKKLAYPANLTNEVILMWEMCRYESARKPTDLSPWCAVFTKDDLQILEYMEDLKYFLNAGYGNEFNYKLGCAFVSDLISRFNGVEMGDDSVLAEVYITHLRGILMALTRFGVAKDKDKLKGDNYESESERRWSLSKIAPSAANFAAILYRCSSGEEFRARFFLNEKPVDIIGCPAGELCSWNDVRTALNSESCDMAWCDSGMQIHCSSFGILVAVLLSSCRKFDWFGF